MFDRVVPLIGLDKFKLIQETKIILVGVGGVGGAALECLVRSGFKNITIIDYDKFEISNTNRQIIMSNKDLDISKVDVAYNRYKSINPDINMNILNEFLDSGNINLLKDYDYVIDACDSIGTKIDIVRYCLSNNIKFISSMGMGNRLDPTMVKVVRLDKTINDPLAEKVWWLLRKEGLSLKFNVVSSNELPVKRGSLDSTIFVPLAAGNLIANYVFNDVING